MAKVRFGRFSDYEREAREWETMVPIWIGDVPVGAVTRVRDDDFVSPGSFERRFGVFEYQVDIPMLLDDTATFEVEQHADPRTFGSVPIEGYRSGGEALSAAKAFVRKELRGRRSPEELRMPGADAWAVRG